MTQNQRKNILFIMVDQQRHDTLSCLGHPVVQTPNLDAFARESSLFTNNHCVSPLCIPSRVSLFSGQYPHKTGAMMNLQTDFIDVTGTTLLEILHENGYRIGLAGKNHVFTDAYLDRWFAYREEYEHKGKIYGELTEADQNYVRYMEDGRRVTGLVEGPVPFKPEECPTYRTAEDGIRFLDEYSQEPFFLFLSFADPHFPHVSPEPYYSMYPPEALPDLEATDIDWSSQPFINFAAFHLGQGVGAADYTTQERKRVLATYYGQITFIDSVLSMVFDQLKELGLMENTVIVYTSDHGDYGGRYGYMGKFTLHDILLRVPLIIRIPDINQGARKHAQVSFIDILPTLLDYLEFEIPADVQGKSFLPVLTGGPDIHRTEIYAEGGYPVVPPPDDLTRELDGIRERMEQNWSKHLEEFHAFRRRGEGGGDYAWPKHILKRGRKATVKRDNWKYTYLVDDKEQLYDLRSDPFEMKNLAYHPACARTKERLKNKLFDWILTEPHV